MLRFILPTLRSKPLSRKKYLWIDALGIASIRNRGDPEQRNETFEERTEGGSKEGLVRSRIRSVPAAHRGISRSWGCINSTLRSSPCLECWPWAQPSLSLPLSLSELVVRPPPPSSDASARGIACTPPRNRETIHPKSLNLVVYHPSRSSNSELLGLAVEDCGGGSFFPTGMELEDEWGEEGRGHGG